MSITLDQGIQTTVVGAATVTGLSFSTIFSVQPRGGGGPVDATFRPHANVNGLTVTTLTCDLESSDDNGVTWSVYPGGGTMTFSALAQVQIAKLNAGLIYRLNIKSLTLGTAASVTINAVAS